MTFWER